MPNIDWKDISLEVDEDGFITNPELWDETIALAIASTEGIENLSDAHWTVIRYIRNYYDRYGIAPMVRKLCKETGCSLKDMYDLFPSGPAKGACRVAGLAKPTGCV